MSALWTSEEIAVVTDGTVSASFEVTGVTFDSREAMERARERGDALKAEKSQEAGAVELDDGEFDLVLAHLRVPELV